MLVLMLAFLQKMLNFVVIIKVYLVVVFNICIVLNIILKLSCFLPLGEVKCEYTKSALQKGSPPKLIRNKKVLKYNQRTIPLILDLNPHTKLVCTWYLLFLSQYQLYMKLYSNDTCFESKSKQREKFENISLTMELILLLLLVSLMLDLFQL